jgi:multidrug resistance efflux pump
VNGGGAPLRSARPPRKDHGRAGALLFCARFARLVLLAWSAPLVLLASLVASGCGPRQPSTADEGSGVIVVNSPASGVVRRVLVREGARVGAGDPVVEIALPSDEPEARPTAEDPRRRAAAGYTAAQGQIEAARSEVVRAQVEVQRLGPLVAAGQASQGELDGAQAIYQRAQQRLQEAETAARRAEGELTSARSRPPAAAEQPRPERIVTARASSAGTVTAVSAREGQSVEAGRPLATLRAGEN